MGSTLLRWTINAVGGCIIAAAYFGLWALKQLGWHLPHPLIWVPVYLTAAAACYGLALWERSIRRRTR